MEHSELLAAVRRPLSPDTQIEVQATREEYDNVQDIIEEENVKFPRIHYDGTRQVAIVSAMPTPLHGEMVGQLLRTISRAVDKMPGLAESIKDGITIATDMRNTKDTGETPTTRNWDGALRYLTKDETGPSHTLMIAVEVGLSQTYASLRAAISYSVCALNCRVGIAMYIKEGNRSKRPSPKYYDTLEEKLAAVGAIENALKSQLQAHPFGPLVVGEDTWFGTIASVALETSRKPPDEITPDTVLDPSQSFFKQAKFQIVEESGFVAGEVPPNLAEITLGDCIPTHILRDNTIEETPVNFFYQDWFEGSFGSSMFQTAMERVMDKCRVRRS
ncbi:hypothetical protein V1509DRAFT_651353 [Lipomyces kononenkoae]